VDYNEGMEARTHRIPVEANLLARFRCNALKLHDFARWELAHLNYVDKKKDPTPVQIRECIACGHLQLRRF
jgi:hypothetical protein